MPDFAQSAQALANGTANVTIAAQIPGGRVWIVSQVGIEAITTQASVTAIMRKNGRFLTSSAVGQGASASGAPYITLKAGDKLTMDWAGLSLGDTAILTVLYNEIAWADLASQQIDVV